MMVAAAQMIMMLDLLFLLPVRHSATMVTLRKDRVAPIFTVFSFVLHITEADRSIAVCTGGRFINALVENSVIAASTAPVY